MTLKIVAGIIALLLLFAFIGVVVFKLKDPALIVVSAIGLGMVVVDLWQSLQSKDE